MDSIVVLGRGDGVRNRRVEIAEQLWREKRSPKIFASGMLDAEFIIEQLKNNGIATQALNGERCSQTTEENALFTAAVLRPQNIQKILLITDPPHMLRSVLSFRASGFTVIPHTSPLPSYWEPERSVPVLLREYTGLVSYAITNRFRQRSPSELEHPPIDVMMKLKTWNCKL
ncbi:MAG: YdcF family protein [Stenomitos rutilans HA7619-LM2]|nr:YdcF family protein [Stenomitos rutilans HA7619-LM2]